MTTTFELTSNPTPDASQEAAFRKLWAILLTEPSEEHKRPPPERQEEPQRRQSAA